MVPSLLTAFLITVAAGGAATAYLWRVHLTRLETASGLRILAGMRWREFSQLVVEALRQRGFEMDPAKNRAERGQQPDIELQRDGQTWLLACRQGWNYQITPTVIGDFSRALRIRGATAGLIATPGRVVGGVREQAGAIELVDGQALWPMLKPLMPTSVRETVAAESRALGVRYVAAGWMAALALGMVVAWLMPVRVEQPAPMPSQAPVAGAGAPRPATVRNGSVALAAAPLSEDEQREHIRQEVSALPGIDRALWSTRSTLLVYLADDSGIDRLPSICKVMEHYDALRASRLQLQPVPGSDRPVRFPQCRAF